MELFEWLENDYCHGWLKLIEYLNKKIIIVMDDWNSLNS